MNQKEIRIAFVFPAFSGGGAQRVAITLLSALDRKIFNPELIVFDENGPLRDTVPHDIPLRIIGKKRLRSAFPQLIKLLRSFNPDIVYSTLSHVNLLLVLARPLLPNKTKLVIREANMPSISLKESPYPKLFMMLYRLLYSRADQVIATSKQMSSEFSEHFRVPKSKLTILPNPVDVQKIRSQIECKQTIPGKGVRFVLAGRLIFQKGYDCLIEIIPKLSRDSQFIILGEGPLEIELRNKAEKLGVAQQITWVGFQKNPWEWFAGADVFILPSRWEGMPNVALEALACGLSVIATSTSGGLPELVENSKPGAIKIADFDTPFVKALQLVQKKEPVGIKPSLLPDCHYLPNVIKQFSNLLTDMVDN